MLPRPRRGSISQPFLPHPSAPEVPLSLPDLPLAAVGRLLAFLSNEDILSLTATCRRLNRKVTKKFFEPYGLCINDGDDSFATRTLIHDANTVKFTRLRTSSIFTHMASIAFEVDRLLSINFKFRLPASQLLRDVRHLSGLVSRLGSLNNVTFNFFGIDQDFGKTRTYGTTLVHGSFDVSAWEMAFGGFLDTVHKKGIPTVCIERGRAIKDLCGSETTPRRQDAPTATDNCSSQDTGQQTFGLGSDTVAQVLEDSMKEMTLMSPNPPSRRRDFFNLGTFKRILSRPPKNPPLVAPPNPPAPQASQWAELPPLSSVTTQTGISPRKSHGRHAVGPGLQTFRAHSPILLSLHPRSVISMVASASSSLATLSLQGQILDNAGWKDILQQIDLPGLLTFGISSDLFVDKEGAALDDLIHFFRRHRTITHLTMHGMHLEDRLLTHTPSPPVLPALQELSAHPWHAAMIVKSHVLGTRDSCWSSPLRSISLTREEYSPYHKRYNYKGPPYATTCNEFEHAFDAISLLPVDVSHGLTLRLGFPPTDQNHEEWMTDHIKQGSKSVICQMIGVRKLVLRCGFLGCFTHAGFTKTLPAFVNLFPDLRELEVGEFGLYTGAKPPRDLQNQLKKKCSRLYKVTVVGCYSFSDDVPNGAATSVGASVGPQATILPVVDESWDTSQQAL